MYFTYLKYSISSIYSYDYEENTLPTNETTYAEPELDLPTRANDNMVASPILMPPPMSVPKPQPKHKPQPQPQPQPQPEEHQVPKSCPPVKVYGKGSIKTTNANVEVRTKSVPCERKVRCFVPSEDIPCYVTNRTNQIGEYTKQLVRYQIGKKIYAQPEKTEKPEMRINMRVTPEKSAGTSKIDVSPVATSKQLKVNKKHFKEKNMTVDDNFDYLQTPMRCSTPTPSVCGSTIMAGHLDFSMIDDLEDTILPANEEVDREINDDDDNDDNENESAVDDAFMMQFINVGTHKPKPADKGMKNEESKDKYCKDWIYKSDGVSTNNSDAPPSLYAQSVAMSDSLMDITSVSRNVYPTIERKYEQGRGITNTNTKDYSNTVFM